MKPALTMNQAMAEAARCLLCHDAPCAAGCPASTAPDVFIRKLRFRNLKGAAKVIKERNVMGGVCAVVCPTCSLCAAGCTAAGLDEPIDIGALQRFIVEHAWEMGFSPLSAGKPNGLKVAIVGSGPAGLSCAAELARAGYQAMVFERLSAPGGMLRHAIPDHRLSPAFLERELEDIRALGVRFRLETAIRTQQDLDSLREQGFGAVFLATGAWRCATLDLPGRPREGVTDALTFLMGAKERPKELRHELAGKDVLVVGGGDTAMDAAVTASLAGARDVFILYRRSFAQMPGSPEEKTLAMDAGVHFMILTQPVGFETRGDRVTGLRVVRTRLGEPDSGGRRRPLPISGTEHSLPADLVVEAIGLSPDTSIREIRSLRTDEAGRIQVTAGQRAAADLPVFAGGDAVRGASVVAKAVCDGKAAAAAIRKELGR